jgi:hypothetical protein
MLEKGRARLLGILDVAHEVDRVLVLGDVPEAVAGDDEELVAVVELRLGRVGAADNKFFDARVAERASDGEDACKGRAGQAKISAIGHVRRVGWRQPHAPLTRLFITKPPASVMRLASC